METETVEQAYERLKPLPGAGVDYLMGHGDGWNDYHNWQKAQQSKEVAPVEAKGLVRIADVVKMIQTEILILEERKHIYTYTIHILKILLTQIKTLPPINSNKQ